MSHLSGQVLFKLPKLYAIYLAGSNPWSCDCQLRKLVAQLTRKGHNESSLAPLNTGNSQGQILQDEPKCSSGGISQQAESKEGKAKSKQDKVLEELWTNMSKYSGGEED